MTGAGAIEHTLESIGFTPKEALVYVALIALGSATAYQVAQRCAVKKPTVYVTLEDLRKKGLVLKIPHAKKALFSARNLEEYLFEQRIRIHAVENILPHLHALRSKSLSNTYFYTGLSGIREALAYKHDSAHGQSYLSCYGNLEGCDPKVMEIYSSWERTSLMRGITARILAQEKDYATHYGETMRLSQEYPDLWQVRLLKNTVFPGHVSFEVADSFVRIMDAKSLYATILDDKAIADSFRNVLEIVWEKGE